MDWLQTPAFFSPSSSNQICWPGFPLHFFRLLLCCLLSQRFSPPPLPGKDLSPLSADCRRCFCQLFWPPPPPLPTQRPSSRLTPSLPQPVQFPGWKVHTHTIQLQYNFIAKCQYTDCTRNVLWCQVHSSHIHACKQYICPSFNTSTFSAMRFDENPSRASTKTEDKKA